MKRKKHDNKYAIAIYLKRGKDDIDLDIALDFQFALLAEDETVLILSTTAETCIFTKKTLNGFYLRADDIKRFIEKQTTHPCNIKVVCRMWYGEGKLIDIGNCFSLTRLEIETFCFSWTIKDFSSLNFYKKAKVLIKSHLNKPLMTFILYLTNEAESANEILNIDIMTHQNTRIATFESSIQDVDGNKHFCGKEDYSIQGKGKIGTFKLKQTKQELDDSKNIFLPNNVLSLNCECTICTGVYLTINEKHDFGVISSDSRTEIFKSLPRIKSSSLQDALISMYDDSILSDMELRTSTKTFRVHKNILSARSPVFSAMFQADMKENAMKYVDITDLDDDTLDKMLIYIYNGIFEVHHWESASELYQAANKYQILILKQLCSEFLASWICATNACEILMLADTHDDEELKKCAQTYILSEKEMMCSDNWKKFMNDNLQLAAEIMYLKCTEQ
ncbi:TD and POZ domain-containing protein 1 [Caerostris darwini]|uniref:TD and POZ domain-containing protein 1 n=1 Tax=Caerostris darwini TaxID=1538125 RepID=A0AAV4VU78_9ARAC|nr:TD and POZ domain-containing protein 1 [Caerostris darwini]